MTRLLVSVRNRSEAAAAFDGGADVIDVKEPGQGSLGAASPDVWQAIQQLFSRSGKSEFTGNPQVTLSAAMGELIDFANRPLVTALAGFHFAKIGLAGCSRIPDWRQRWDRWMQVLPRETDPVAVTYADYRSSNAPTPSQVIAAASDAGIRMLLIDTHNKNAGDLFAAMTAEELRDVVAQSRAHNLMLALAGSLQLSTLPKALTFEPELVAVRGAVCRGGRESVLDKELVKHFAQQLSTPRAQNENSSRRHTIDSLAG